MKMTEKLRHKRELFLSGTLKCIPFVQMPRLTAYFPGVIKGMLDCITANTTVGKTTVAKQLYVINCIKFAIQNNLDLKILYFALEESEEQFDYTLYSHIVREELNLRLNIRDFESFNTSIAEETLSLIEASRADEILQQWKSYINIYDNVYNSYGIYKTIREFAQSRGTFYMNDEACKTEEDLFHWNNYVPNNPNEFIICVIDHISELHPDQKENTVDNAITNIIRYMRHYVTKRFDYNVCVIHQQAAEKENIDHKKENYTRASAQGLGDNKKVGRSYMNIIGVNDPVRYGYTVYPAKNGYATAPLSSYFRTINIIKQRYGPTNVEIGIFFDGKTGYIKELPKPDDTENMTRVHKLIESYDSTT